jgi:predicted nucleic acid-binding protein
VKIYCDSSFLVSLYSPDANSQAATAELQKRRGSVLLLSALAEVEVLNAFELRVFRKELTRDEAARSTSAFASDVKAGTFTSLDLDFAIFQRAKELIAATSADGGCRTADVLHVGSALEAGAERLLTFDDRQKELAKRMKLRVNT